MKELLRILDVASQRSHYLIGCISYCTNQLIYKLKHLTGRFLYGLIVIHINTIQYNEQISYFKTKNNKLKTLIHA